jgi:hypothetical protein
VKQLVHTLEGIGQNLLSLRIRIAFTEALTLPQEVLELCPRLEKLDTVLCLRYPPPPNHPLHIVHLPLPFYEHYGRNYSVVSPFPPGIDGWESVGTFIVSVDWRELKDSHAPFFQLVKDWGLVCQQHGMVVEDRLGVSLQDSDRI